MNTPKFDTIYSSYLKPLQEDKHYKTFKPSQKVTYTFNEVKAGTISDDERRVYDAVDLGSEYTGKDLLDYLKDEIKLDPREDLNISKLSRILTSLLDKGVLEASMAAKTGEEGDIPALEAPDSSDIDMSFARVGKEIDPYFSRTRSPYAQD